MRRILRAIRQGRIPRSCRHMRDYRVLARSGIVRPEELRRAWIAANFWVWGKP